MTIGFEPITETLVLVDGQDFVHDIFPPAGEEIPAATTADLKFYDPSGDVSATWSASVSSAAIAWNVSSALADTIAIPSSFRIYVHYSDGADFCWFQGQVTRP
jgi:hypothetical protein